MSLLSNLINGIRHIEHSVSQAPQSAPAAPIPQFLTVGGAAQPLQLQPHPAVGVMGADGHYTPAPAQRFVRNLPQVQSPQNLTPYSNGQGQQWMENDSTDQKLPTPNLQRIIGPTDTQIIPHGPYDRPTIAAPQWQQTNVTPRIRVI